MRRHPRRHRNIVPPRLSQHPIHQLRPCLRVPKRSRSPQNLHLGRLKRQRHRKRIIHIISNVSINNDFFRSARRGLTRTHSEENQKPCHKNHCPHAASLHTRDCRRPGCPVLLFPFFGKRRAGIFRARLRISRSSFHTVYSHMKIILSLSPAAQLEAECLVAVVLDRSEKAKGEKDKTEPYVSADNLVTQSAADLLSGGDVTGKTFETAWLHKPAGLKAKRLLLIGGGKSKKFTSSDLRKLAGAVARAH